MDEIHLKDIFDEVSIEMRSGLGKARAALRHSLSKGFSVEQIFRDFWSEYLPTNVGIAEGFVIGIDSPPSKQQDIIFYQMDRAPVLYKQGNLRVIPVEATAAVCEVKTSIDCYDDVEDILKKALSYKRLERKAYFDQTQSDIIHPKRMFGEERANWGSIFFGNALTGAPIEKIRSWLQEAHKKHNVEFDLGVDALFVLDQGSIVNAVETSLDLLPSRISTTVAMNGEDNLLFFYLVASKYLCQVDLGHVAIQRYGGNIKVQMVPNLVVE